MLLTAIYPLLLLTLVHAAPKGNKPPHKDKPAHTDKPDCTTVAECKKHGNQIWNQIKAAKADAPGLSDKYKQYEQYVNHADSHAIPTDRDIGKDVKEAMKGIFDVPAELNRTKIDGKQPGSVAFDHLFADGFIVTLRNVRELDPVRDDKAKKGATWDVVAVEGYRSVAGNPSNLKYVLKYDTQNKGTKAVLEELYKDGGKKYAAVGKETEWRTWTYDGSQDHKDAFLGLLGTPSGSGTGYILVDYAKTLHKKTIAKMLTKKVGDKWSIVAEYSDGDESCPPDN